LRERSGDRLHQSRGVVLAFLDTERCCL
jgi:hypothetical protein